MLRQTWNIYIDQKQRWETRLFVISDRISEQNCKPLTSFNLAVFIEIIHLQTIKARQQLSTKLQWESHIDKNRLERD